MKEILFYLSLIFLFNCCSTVSNRKNEKASESMFMKKCEKVNIDSFFIKWNTTTMRFIESTLKHENDTLISSYCRAVAGNFMAMNSLNRIDEINQSSIRYSFLKEIDLRENKCPPLFVIETRSDGEQVILKNFLIFSSERLVNVDSILCYSYINKKWVESKKSIGGNFFFQKTQFGKGQNPGDIIITKLGPMWNIKSSEYFVYNTLNISPFMYE